MPLVSEFVSGVRDVLRTSETVVTRPEADFDWSSVLLAVLRGARRRAGARPSTGTRTGHIHRQNGHHLRRLRAGRRLRPLRPGAGAPPWPASPWPSDGRGRQYARRCLDPRHQLHRQCRPQGRHRTRDRGAVDSGGAAARSPASAPAMSRGLPSSDASQPISRSPMCGTRRW